MGTCSPAGSSTRAQNFAQAPPPPPPGSPDKVSFMHRYLSCLCLLCLWTARDTEGLTCNDAYVVFSYQEDVDG